MLDLGALKIGIKVDNNEANSKLNDTKKAVGDVGESSSQSGGKMEKFKSGLKTAGKVAGIATAAVTGTVGAVKHFTDKLAENGDEIDKQSQKLGISAEGYQELSYVCDRSGVSVDVFKRGMGTLKDQVMQNSSAFEELGVKIRDNDGNLRSNEDIMWDSIKALSEMEDGAERSSKASELFGKKAGTELGPLLNTGAKGIDDLRQNLHDLGGVMSDDTVKAAADYQDAMTDLDEATGGVKTAIIEELLPYIKDFAKWISDHMPEIKKIIKKTFDKFEDFGKFIIEHKDIIIAGLTGIGTAFLLFKVASIIEAATTALEGMSFAQGVLNAVMSANPITIVIIAIGLLVAAGVLLYKNWDKVKEAAEKLWATIKEVFHNIKTWIIKAFEGVIEFFKGLPSTFVNCGKAMFNGLWKGLKSIWSSIWGWIKGIPKSVSNLFKNFSLFSAGKAMFSSFWNGLKSVWSGIWGWVSDKAQAIKDKLNPTKWFGGKGKGHRTGLYEVPYDEYPASLHKGEMVLTAAEANRYRENLHNANLRENTQANKQITINFNGSYQFRERKDIDYFLEQATEQTNRRLITC